MSSALSVFMLGILHLFRYPLLEEEGTDAGALQYPRCYSTSGTVHEMAAARERERRLGLGALGTPAGPARGKGVPSNLLLD